MESHIKTGDVIIAEQQPDRDNDDVAVVLINGLDTTVRRIKRAL